MGFLKNLFNKPDPQQGKQTSWEELGTIVDEFEIQYLHPDHHNYPSWPGGERWLRLLKSHWGTWIVFTQGLSAPAGREGFELYLESGEEIEAFSSSWQANLVYEMGKIIPNVADLATRIQNNKLLSVQIEIDGAPDDWSLAHPNGNIGLMLGLSNPHLEHFQPASFRALNVKLLRPSEMLYIITNGAEGRIKVARLLEQQGAVTVSSMGRKAVI